MGTIPTFSSKRINGITKNHTSTSGERKCTLDSSSNIDTDGYLALEIPEEDSNEKDHFKLFAFYITHVFYTLCNEKTESLLAKAIPFNKHFAYNSSSRYIEFQTFRI